MTYHFPSSFCHPITHSSGGLHKNPHRGGAFKLRLIQFHFKLHEQIRKILNLFFPNRKNQIPPIDFDAYTRWRRRHLHDPAPDVTATIDTTTTTPSQAPAPTPSPPSAIVAGTAPETTISSASTTSPSQIPPSESETTALTSPTPTPTPTSTTTTNNTSSPQPDLTPLLPPPSSNSEVAPPPAPAPYPTSFSAIVELISSGKPIQGIKEIPKTVLEGQGSLVTVKTPRKKPWEKQQQGREQC